MNENNRLGAIIDKLAEQLGVRNRLKMESIWELWDDEVGERIKTHTQVVGVKGDTLVVKVDNAVWMYQLVLLKGEIMEKINQRLGKTLIHNIHFKIGKLGKDAPQAERTNPQLGSTALPDEEIAKIEGSLSEIEDDKMRDVLCRLMVKDKKLKMSRRKR
jgi:predicted nucleic acid-binding Zn ribbon protein